MHLLIIGGSVFVGRHIVDAALARGHKVTVFNRGTHAGALPAGVEQLRGDRNADFNALQGRHFDAVIDCCAYTPEQMTLACTALRDATGHYLLISTISLYSSFPPGLAWDESAPVTDDTGGYGGGKARAEEVLQTSFANRCTSIRPGLIVGPHDPTGRFTYWPLRVAQGGVVLAPGRPERPVQFIDARDLAAWCVAMAERKTIGIFNAVGPADSMAVFLETCRAVCNPQAQFQWIADGDLVKAGVAMWTGLPLWIPEDEPGFGGMLLGKGEKARAAGLFTRPWADTVRDTLAWALQAGEAARGNAGLSAAQESALLQLQLL